MKFRQWILFAVIVAFLVHIGSRMIIYADFYLNQDYIAQTLCVNKDKPELKCNGQCHLMKTLKQDDQRKSDEDKTIARVEIVYFLSTEKSVEIQASTVEFGEDQAYGNNFIDLKTKRITEDIFHPPIA